MSKSPDLRQIKDKAAKAVEKRNFGKAAELYVEIAQYEDDPDWRQRAGDAFRRANKPAEAAEQLIEAAEGYARGGFLLKAIAVCKVVLQLDPRHTATQQRLAELYAMKDGSSRGQSSESGRLPVVAPVELGRTESGNFTVAPSMPRPAPLPERVPVADPMALRAAPPVRSAPPVRAPEPDDDSISLPLGLFPGLPTTAPPPPPPRPEVSLSSAFEVGTEEMDSVSLPAGAPMDVLPLASVLGSRKSRGMPAVRPDEKQLDGQAYEIDLEPRRTLDPLPLDDEPAPAPDPDELTIEAEPTRTPAPIPVALAPPIDEMDFSGVSDDAAPLPRARPVAAPPGDELDFSAVIDDAAPMPPNRGIHPPPAPPTDEMDFSGVMDEAPPKPLRPEMPIIPLFSSLTAAELQQLIEGVEVRDFGPGEAIVRQGDPGVALYVVVHGKVQVVLEGPPRKPQATLGEGAFFGELALLTDFPRSATVEAIEQTQLLEISRDLIAKVISESPDVLKVLLRFFRDRMLDRLLATSPVFQHFSPQDARGLVERFKFLEIDPKTRIIREGERATGLFLLLCGDASVVKGTTAIAKLAPGDLFGEMSMLQRGPAVASIDTHTKCWALQLERADFQEIMLTYPQLLEFIADLADKRRAAAASGKDGHVDFL
jgi:CRP-like cAMP-binding protein